ncbi:hypothetical protein HG535_0C01790 [Zygotorulaspora mrakii]|uniref:Uncharacterized protein n=1 Tax=Zygotorulaspora mrakii TaxID=42260 RepID=A0A7H9AZP0_ZYGMR|nr:uncharacterized protein HG535_0C01790 [Zygotorulaspora mrakii]QLG71830.1 hypothetical protein HG535_0C01790 [Zygotorulaspora mrakii]
MNSLFLQYQFGNIHDGALQRLARKSEFERLLESATPNCYKYARGKKDVSGISCLEMDDTTGQFLLSCGTDGSVSVWSLDEKLDTVNNELYSKRINYNAKSIGTEELSPSKKRAKTSSPAPRMVHSFETRQSKFRMYRQSSDLNKLAEQETEDNSISEGHRFRIASAKWYSIDNGMFFTGSNDCRVKIWDTNSFEPVQEVNLDYRINQIDTDNEGTYIVAATEDYFPRIIDLKNIVSSGITNLSSQDMNHEILCCKFNPVKTHIVSTGDSQGNIKLWDLRMRNRLLLELRQRDSRRAHLKSCNDLCWNAGGTELASTGNDGKCYIWSPFTTPISSRQIGPMDLMRNNSKKRTSQRLLRFEDYLLCNTDYGEIQVFETAEGKLCNKIDYPVSQLPSKSDAARFSGMAMQSSLANSRGIRLYLGTTAANSNGMENSACLCEYM